MSLLVWVAETITRERVVRGSRQLQLEIKTAFCLVRGSVIHYTVSRWEGGWMGGGGGGGGSVIHYTVSHGVVGWVGAGDSPSCLYLKAVCVCVCVCVRPCVRVCV